MIRLCVHVKMDIMWSALVSMLKWIICDLPSCHPFRKVPPFFPTLTCSSPSRPPPSCYPPLCPPPWWHIPIVPFWNMSRTHAKRYAYCIDVKLILKSEDKLLNTQDSKKENCEENNISYAKYDSVHVALCTLKDVIKTSYIIRK